MNDSVERSTLDSLIAKQLADAGLRTPPATSPSVASLSHRHTAIMDFMLANPEIKLSEVASHFGMTQAWLSTVIHSDCFQSELKDKQGALFDETVLNLRDKITGAAHRALDRLGEKLDTVDDPKFILDASEKTLKALGYGTSTSISQSKTINNVQNNYTVPANIHADARQRMLDRGRLSDILDAESQIPEAGEAGPPSAEGAQENGAEPKNLPAAKPQQGDGDSE